jgi:hypothetical protein
MLIFLINSASKSAKYIFLKILSKKIWEDRTNAPILGSEIGHYVKISSWNNLPGFGCVPPPNDIEDICSFALLTVKTSAVL